MCFCSRICIRVLGENQRIKNRDQLRGHIQFEIDLLRELGYHVFLVCKPFNRVWLFSNINVWLRPILPASLVLMRH